MRVLHFGDIHYWKIGTDVDFLYLKRILGPVNLLLRRHKKFPPDHAHRIAADIATREADLVIFSGDATTMSLKAEFDRAAKAFAPIHEKWGDRFFCIPGNHDRYSPRSVARKYWEKAFPFSQFDQYRVQSRDVGGGLSIVGFDASVPWRVRSNGLFTEGLKAELDAELERLGAEGKRILLVGHYPFAYPRGIMAAAHHKLIGEELLAESIARFKPGVYLHGHKHVRWALKSGETLCLNCGAAGMTSSDEARQAGYLEFEFDPRTSAVASLTARVLRGDGVESVALDLPD
ncbi:MAG: metallophosphoesterase [Verrucomicrobiota bacterium]